MQLVQLFGLWLPRLPTRKGRLSHIWSKKNSDLSMVTDPGQLLAMMGSAEALSDEEESCLRALLNTNVLQFSEEGSSPLYATESLPEETRRVLADATEQRGDIGNVVNLLLCAERPISVKEGVEAFESMDQDTEGRDHPAMASFLERHSDCDFEYRLRLADTNGDANTRRLVSGGGRISRTDWLTCLEELYLEHVNTLRLRGLLQHQAFWGRQSEWRCHQRQNLFWSSWIADFVYYQQNNHPLLSIACHTNPRALHGERTVRALSTSSRLILELVVTGWSLLFGASLMCAHHHDSWGVGGSFVVGVTAITIPTMILYKCMTYLFSCACCLGRYENVKGTWASCFSFLVRQCSYVCKVMMFVQGCILLGVGIMEIVSDYDCHSWIIHSWLFGRGFAYLVHPIEDLLLHFNPMGIALACAQGPGSCNRFMAYLGLARWQSQREQVMKQLVTWSKPGQPLPPPPPPSPPPGHRTSSTSSAAGIFVYNPTYSPAQAPVEAYDVSVIRL